jgi:hypothetical protein
MRLILFADAGAPRKTLHKLFLDTEHRLQWYSLDEAATCDLEACDMVLLDGSGRGCAAQERLLKAAQVLRSRLQRKPVLIFSEFDSDAARSVASPGCRVTGSGDGAWHVHCRLKELAWGETEALLRDALTHDAPEPVVFEYRG